jgi:hypothetical protein
MHNHLAVGLVSDSLDAASMVIVAVGSAVVQSRSTLP